MAIDNYTPEQIEEILQAFFEVAGTRQYIGARYVPIFGRGRGTPIEWDNSDAYEPLSIVYYQGDTYTSRRYVPAGIAIDNQDYWVITGRYNAQVEQYRQEVLGFADDIQHVQDNVDALRDDVADEYVPFPDSDHYPKYGTLGQVLTTLSDGKTKWENPVVPSDAQAETVITAWLADHPEATTTVQDNSLTTAKYQNDSVTKPKMNKQGIPLEQKAIINGLRFLMSALSGEAIEIPFIQGNYASDLILRNVATQVSTEPFSIPNGFVMEMTTITAPQGRRVTFQKFVETSDMSGTYTRTQQISITDTPLVVTANSNELYNMTCINTDGITPTDVSVTVKLSANPNTIFSAINTLNSNAYLRQITTDSTDLNDYTTVGGYSVNYTYTNVPSDMASNGTLHCFQISGTRKLQILAVGGNSPQMYFRTWGTIDGFGTWNKLYPITLPESEDEIRLSYSSANQYTIDIGVVTLLLTYTNNASTDSDLWNVYRPLIKSNNTPVDSGDIIGPIRINDASDFIFGIHGSATTTVFGAYMDGEEVTLNSSTDVTGNELTIVMHDEGRHPDNLDHVFDRDVTIRISKGKLWCSNTIKNVSGNTLTIASACNGGLIAAFKNIINGISTNDLITKVPLEASIAANPNRTSCTFMLDGCTMSAHNIIGHESANYTSEVVNYTGDPGRNKVYFYTARGAYQMADGSSLYGEFEYEYR